MVLATLWAAAAVSSATTYYASTTGSRANSGLSTSAPWSLSYALSSAPAGSTVIVLPGTYSGDWEISVPNLTVRSQTKWAARLLNMPYGVVLGYGGSAPGITLDGFEIAYASGHNVLVCSPHCTVRNCWIHDAGIRSRPNNRADNNSGVKTYTSSSNDAVDYTTVEYCLLENNGSSPGGDHGVYLCGHHLLVRGNVLRGNYGMGINIYSSYGLAADGAIYENLVYGNGVGGKGVYPFTDGVMLKTSGAGPLYFYNNTVQALNGYPLDVSTGTAYCTNNIFIGPDASHMVNVYGGPLYEDYNLANYRFHGGAHDIISSAANFVNPSKGLFWLTATSPARGKANTSVVPPVDCFGTPQTSVADIGAVQYNSAYASDTRVLDPSPAGGADYWKILGSASGFPGSGATSNGITIQASAGTLTAPFVVTNGYVCQFVDTENADGGRAVFNFTITNAGVYVVSAVVNAANTSRNSFYVSIDGTLSEPYTVWDLPVTSGFQSAAVSWRGNGTWDANTFVPKAFALSAGTHSLIIGGRESNTLLQSIQIQPSSLTAPASAPVLRQFVGP